MEGMEDARGDLFWFVAIMIGIAFLWFYTGGPDRPAATSGPFLDSPLEKSQAELHRTTQETLGWGIDEEKYGVTQNETEVVSVDSIYKTKATLRTGYNTKEEDPQKEYLEIRASSQNKEAIIISNWTIKGKSNLDITIGKGSYLPYSGRINPQEVIKLEPGEKAVIITGRSPIGTSFRLNECTGYFQQFQDFIPRLPKECPYPREEYIPEYLNEDCVEYIERLPKCEFPINALPPNLLSTCHNYIIENINYKTCVQNHKSDANFYKKEWRVYLNRDEEIWKNKHDTITLYDENGATIDWDTY